MNALAAAWNAFWFAPAVPWPLGVCRAGFFGSFYVLFLARIDLRWYALFPPEFYQPRSFFDWLSLPMPNWEVLAWLVTAFELSVILASLGLLTRLATFVAFVLGLYLLGLQFNYGYLHWAHAIVPIVMGILALSPCGDALSLDALLRRVIRGKAADTGGQYRWPIRLVWLVFVTVFLAAGLAKLRQAGLEWVLSDTLRNYFLENQYVFHSEGASGWRHLLADWLIARPGLCRVLAGMVLAVELSAPAALFSHHARRWLIPLLFLFQVGNALLLYQDFFFAYLGLYLFWMPWGREERLVIRQGIIHDDSVDYTSGGTSVSSREIRGGGSSCTVSQTRCKLTLKYPCTRRFRMPTIPLQGISECVSLPSGLIREAASPTISTAFRMASCAMRFRSNASKVRSAANFLASRAASSMSSK